MNDFPLHVESTGTSVFLTKFPEILSYNDALLTDID